MALLVAANVGAVVLLLILMEGAASILLFVRDAAGTRSLAERRHTRFDAELGWVNAPGVEVADMYAPGVGLTTNARGFRGAREVAPEPLPGVRRVVCSGDSFTLGYGVADEQTWCSLLEQTGGIEAVNMGQGGYGLDQAYLWYLRDGAALTHHVHVLAFISDDLRRMRHADFMGFAKPVLRLDGDSLITTNVPVPRSGYGPRALLTRYVEPLRSLRLTELMERTVARRTEQRALVSVEETSEVARRIVRRLAAEHRAADRTFLLVRLPTDYELEGTAGVAWAGVLQEEAQRLGVRYLDLLEAFRSLPESGRSELFLRPGEVLYPAAAGHLSAAGNALVARMIGAELFGGAAGSGGPGPD